MADRDTQMDAFTLPEGRLINHSLFVKDAYDDKSVPSYKLEVAIEGDPETNPQLAELENRLLDAADGHWGDGAGDDEGLILPLLDGNLLKKKREKKGKQGDAYAGMTVIRANTLYNRDGIDGPGGIQVYDPDAEPILPANQGQIYQGCYGIVGVTIGFYEDDRTGNNGLKFYLAAFQKTRDGERLVTASDRSTLFKPVGREGGGSRRSRRSRRG